MLKIRRKKLMNTKKQSVYLIALFFVSVFMGIGYSYLSSTLSVNGYTTVYKNNWDVHFENLEVTEGSISTGTSSITNNSTIVNYQVPLAETGQYYEFTVDVVNNGSIDAMVGSVVYSGITTEQSDYIEYSATYTSDISVKEKDLLPAGSSQKILVKVKYKGDIPNSSLPTEDQTLNLTFNMSYIESNNEVEVKHPVCKRAKTLHTEICQGRSDRKEINYHCTAHVSGVGQDIIYGYLGTSGTLTSGDAFDCDVNGDKKYDPKTERFYYMTDLDNSSDYAVLIYYNATANGEPNAYSYFQYESNDTPRVNGPADIKNQLPTTSQWKNVNLSNTSRVLKDEVGNEYGTINYSGYAARMVTTQEIERACNDTMANISNITGGAQYGIIYNKCNYLLENGQFTYFSTTGYNRSAVTFENVYSGNSAEVFYISGWGRLIGHSNANNNWYGVHPVIEVPKSKISY
ncbi:MAG: hypothetical protein IJF92_01040 [Bacilli bacterium]|nr:hypothetical protein [Bacilli bacterium]